MNKILSASEIFPKTTMGVRHAIYARRSVRDYCSVASDQVAKGADKQNDLARRDGSIRGVMLNTETANLDRVFGLTKPTKDFSF